MHDNMSVMETFADRLFTIMERRGVSQYQLSEKTGVSQSTISLWKVRGSIPKADYAIMVADYLNVPVDYLVFGSSKAGGIADRIYKLKGDQIDVVKAVVETFEKQNNIS